MRLSISIILILFYAWSSAQTPVPCFTIDQPSGCVPHTINVSNCSGSTNLPQYVYDSGTPTVDSSYEYTQPGSYQVIQAIDDGSGQFEFDTQYVTVFPIPNPEFVISNCGNNEVYMEIPNLGYDSYIINWNDGNIDTFSTSQSVTHSYSNSNPRSVNLLGLYSPENCGNDTTIVITPFQNYTFPNIDTLSIISNSQISLKISGQSHVVYIVDVYENNTLISTHQVLTNENSFMDTINGLNTSSNSYCFIVSPFNKCSNAIVSTSISNKVCSTPLSSFSQDGFINITWDTYAGDNFDNFILTKNETGYSNLSLNQNYSINDSSIFCNQEYNYQLYTYASNHSQSVSISNISNAIGKSESSPNPVTQVYSTYNANNELLITWKSPSKIPPKFYTINTVQATDTFLVLSNATETCYEITYTDSCGNTSLTSEETCPIQLNTALSSMFDIELTWNEYKTFNQGMYQYKIHVYDQNKNNVETIDNMLFNSYTYNINGNDEQIYYFIIEGVSNDSIQTYSNEVKVEISNLIKVPNAFSPNNDGVNDIFAPKIRFIKEYSLAIYNKWGASLFYSDDINKGWDGEDFPSGVYTYVIEVSDYLGNTSVKNGTVTLIK